MDGDYPGFSMCIIKSASKNNDLFALNGQFLNFSKCLSYVFWDNQVFSSLFHYCGEVHIYTYKYIIGFLILSCLCTSRINSIKYLMKVLLGLFFSNLLSDPVSHLGTLLLCLLWSWPVTFYVVLISFLFFKVVLP